MANFVGGVPSIQAIYFAGGVDFNDNLYCRAQSMSDRIRIQCGNSEQRMPAVAQYVAIWQK
jgi:hypothetical protein